MIDSQYSNNSITWPEEDKTSLDGVVLTLDMRVLIAYCLHIWRK